MGVLSAYSPDVARRTEADPQIKFQATILQHVRDSVIVTDLNRIVTYWNEGATQIFGYSAGEMLGTRVDVLFPEPIAADAAVRVQRALEGDEYSGERRGRRKDGTLVWIAIKYAQIREADGTVTGLLGISQDIDARKQAEEALRRSEQYFRLLIERATDVITVLNADGTVRYASPRGEQVFGLVPESMVGTPALQLVHPDDLPEMTKTLAKITDSPSSSGLAR